MFAPAYKAAIYIRVVCRKYYIEILRNEIHSSNYFQATNLTEQQIVNEHLNVKNQLRAGSDNMKVQTIY